MMRSLLRTLLWSLGLLAAASALAADGPPMSPRTGPIGSHLTEGRLAGPGRELYRRPAERFGEAGFPAPDADKPFSLPRASGLADRIEKLGEAGAPVSDEKSWARALALLPDFRRDLQRLEDGELADDELGTLVQRQLELENLEGLALNGEHRLASFRTTRAGEAAREIPAWPPEDLFGVIPKVNTGWIYDQHLFDPDLPMVLPTLYSDYRNYDIGRTDIAMGHSDHPPGGMFGWMWHVQSFYWTDTTLVSNHPNPSYCLFVLVSGDGGATWMFYDLLYDPATSPDTSRDLINPKLAVDVSGPYDIYYIAYEFVTSESNHDIYIYYDVSELPLYDGTPGGTSNPVNGALASTTNMERNPAVASEYKTADATRYQVVAWEYAYSATDTDIRARQSYGNGSASWTAAVDVAATVAMETHPALAVGCSGGVTFTSYMHLAYNYDTFSTVNTQILLNPGFESGNNGNWTVRVAGDIDCSGNYDRTGSCAAWLGGIVNYPSWPGDWIYQAVTIPADAPGALLSLWLRVTSNETGSTPYDYFYIDVRNTSGTLLQNLGTFSNADEVTYATYQQLTYDLSGYRGQTVRLYFWATNDGSYTSSFFVDDTALNIIPASEVRYRRGEHPTGAAPGATPYPSGLAAFTPLTVLENVGDSPVWPYGPPAIGASHGGSTTVTGGRVLVAADQLFPQDWPDPGNPARYQLTYAVNMCNGGTGCGDISVCTPALSLDWNAYYWNDPSGDYRYPSIVVDGVGWVEGTSGVPQNGVTLWPEMFMAYYYRNFKSPSLYGGANMDLTFAHEEDCAGFQSGAWYYFTASEKASDDDDLVVPKEGTIATFNYFAGWPGITFNKNIYHPGATVNDDPFFTTPGDNYTIDTTAGGVHIDGYWSFNEEYYLGPWTFAWPAAITWNITVNSDAAHNGRYYTFDQWSTGETGTTVSILSDYCPPSPPCPVTSINALFEDGSCPVPPPATENLRSTRQGTSVRLDWTAGWASGDVAHYTIYKATDCSSAGNYTVAGSTVDPTFTDDDATGSLYFYIVATTCGPYVGPWGHYGQ